MDKIKQKRSFKGIWIPKELWLTTELKPFEKLLLLEIDSLDKGEKHCFASNSHFTKLFGCGTSTINRTIQSLESKNIIETTTKHTQKGVKRVVKSNLSDWIVNESAKIKMNLAKESKETLPNVHNEPLTNINNNNINNKRVTKVTLAEKNSAEIIPEEISFTEEEFKLDDDPEEKFKDPMIQWIVEITAAAKDRSLSKKSTQPFFIPRNDSAKYLVKIKQYMHELSNGSFLRTHKFSKAFLQHIDMPSMKIFHGLTDEALMKLTEQAVSNYLTARNNPEKHDFISRDRKIDLGVFFYEFNEKNGVLGVSHFLQYFNAEPEEANAITRKEHMLQTIYKKDLSKMYSSVYIHYEDFSDEEMLRMVKSILSLCRWWNRNEERLMLIYRGKLKIRFPHGLETFIEHHLARFIASNRFEHAISLFPEKKHWKAFLDFIYDETEIDLEAEVKVDKKKKSSVSMEEIERRMEAD